MQEVFQRFSEPFLLCNVCSERLPDLTSLIHIRAGTCRVGRLPGFGHWAQLFSLGAIHLSLVVALCICCVAAYVLATLGTHYIPSASSHFPSILVSWVSIYPSTFLLHGRAHSVPPLPAHRLKPSISGAELFYTLPNLHIYMCTCKYIYTQTCSVGNHVYSITYLLRNIFATRESSQRQGKAEEYPRKSFKHGVNPN